MLDSFHPPTISNHGLVVASIPFLFEAPSYFVRQVRDWRSLDRAAFKSALLNIPAIADPSTLEDLPVADIFAVYESTMTDLLTQFLPTRHTKVRRRPLSPWFDGECRSLRREVRRLERRYRRTRSPVDHTAWIKSVRDMHRRYRGKERDHWEARIAANADQPKRLWATFNALLGRGQADRSQHVPSFTADDYLTSFTTKVHNIREDTAGSLPPAYPPTSFNLSTLTPVNSADLRRIILASPPKSCELDSLPTSLLQEFVDVLLPLLTVLCNRSILEGILPPSQKRSILVPVLKCEGLDSDNPVNFRPIANVSFISKLIEKIVALQLTSYLETHNLLPEIQSGFRKGHSTETLLLRLLSDVYGAIDRSQLTLLALFDVSAAFDTVDHDILLERLHISFGLSGTLLLWLRSFLSDRSFSVVHGPSRSLWVPAPYGLPQGSVLGPLLFIIYTSDLASLLASHAMQAHLYADDVQAYQHCRASDTVATVRSMYFAMEALGTWMSSNRLRLNSLKTQFIWLGTRQQLKKLDMTTIADAFPDFVFSTRVRDLGVTLDQELTFAPHIHSLSRACYYQLRQLRTVARSLTPTAAATLVHSFVTTRLDYCCSLYAGLPISRLSCIDRVLRSAARLIGRIPKFSHISSYMRDVLHWLPLKQRIEYRISTLVWRCMLGLAPAYLCELCSPTLSSHPFRSLRSTEQSLLSVPFARTSTMQSRAFSVVGPSTWNGLPLTLRSLCKNPSQTFLSHLKTVLFGRAEVGSASE